MIEIKVVRLMIPEGTIIISVDKENFEYFIDSCLDRDEVTVFILRGRRYMIIENSITMILEESLDGDDSHEKISFY